MADDLQLSCADVIRDTYVQYRRRSQGSYLPSAKQDEAFRATAALCRSLSADPRIFIEAQFLVGVWGDGKFPYPNQLHSANAEANYHAYQNRENLVPQANLIVAQQFKYLSSFTDKCGLEIDQALGQPPSSNPFRAFFKVLVCSEDAFPEMMERYGKNARAELRANPDILQFLLTQYEHRTQRILQQAVPGHDDGPRSAPPPFTIPGRSREI